MVIVKPAAVLMDMDNILMIATKNSNFIVCDFVVILFFGRMI